MKICKVLVSLILLGCFFNCKNNISNNHKSLDNTNKITNEENFICMFSNKSLKSYDQKLRSLYKQTPESLKNELRKDSEKYASEIISIFKSAYESKFKVITEYKLDEDTCTGELYYITNDKIERDGEIYNIESSVILKLKFFDSKIKITSIIMAG